MTNARAALLASALLWAGPAAAWGPLGHKAVARVAENRLSPRARAAVQGLLGPNGRLEMVANCPDDILYTSATVRCGGLFDMDGDLGRKTGPWHYVNIPATATLTAANLMSFCPGGDGCVVAQIPLQAKALADASLPAAKRQAALAFLVHFVGDLHQPLHAADDDDMGGNKKPVTILGASKNLHSLWDGLIRPDDWRVMALEDPAAVVAQAEAAVAGANSPAWRSGDFTSAGALESHELAREIYARYAVDHGRNLGAVYQGETQPIVYRRIGMAGVRLAALIEKALAP